MKFLPDGLYFLSEIGGVWRPSALLGRQTSQRKMSASGNFLSKCDRILA